MQIQCEIWRGTEKGRGSFVTYSLNMQPGDMVLDVLETLYHEQDPSLSYRYACGIARCGECAMVVNGVPCLACEKKAEPDMRIEPLGRLPLIKDTVIDRRQIFDHIHRLLPEPADLEDIHAGLETIGEEEAKQRIENSVRLTTCYECMICQSVCPRYDITKDTFPGPLGLLILAQMKENPAQRAIPEDCLMTLSESCLSCGKCIRNCPSESRPLELALTLLGHAPKALRNRQG